MGSNRLAAKTLLSLGGITLIDRVLDFCFKIEGVSDVVLATTEKVEDDELVRHVSKRDVCVYRGSEHDVLDRFYRCAQHFEANAIIRITADDPLKDIALARLMVNFFIEHCSKYDYVSNNLKATYPEGQDIEIFSFDALQKANSLASLSSDREHVTSFIWSNPTMFRLFNFDAPQNYSHLRLTMDTRTDYIFLCELINKLGEKPPTAENVANLVLENRELANLMVSKERNEAFNLQRSLENKEN